MPPLYECSVCTHTHIYIYIYISLHSVHIARIFFVLLQIIFIRFSFLISNILFRISFRDCYHGNSEIRVLIFKSINKLCFMSDKSKYVNGTLT